MSNPDMVLRLRHRQARRRRQRASRGLATSGLGCSILISALMALVGVVATLAYAYLTRDLPSPTALAAMLDPVSGTLLHPTRFYDRSGQVVLHTLEHPQAAPRRYLSLDSDLGEHLPADLEMVTVAASDPDFWRHPGFTLDSLRSGGRLTLAQRLVSQLLMWNESPGVLRTAREALLAAQITHQFGRQSILEWFLNSAHYGNMTYGVDAAAQLYFGKAASRLDLAEAAVLAAVAEAPALNPLDTPAEAVQRQRELLVRLLEEGQINTARFRAAMAVELEFQDHPPAGQPALAAFLNLASDHLAGQASRERLARGGLRVITTLDAGLQRQADCTLQAQLALLTGRPTQPSGLQDKPCEAAQLLPPQAAAEGSPELAAGVVVLEAQTGNILALAGDPNPDRTPAGGTGRPAGSLLTPYVHLAAYTRGFGPASLAWDIPARVPSGLEELSPEKMSFQGPMRLRVALANDYLVPSLDLLAQIGPENVWRTIPQLGLPSLQARGGQDGFRLLFEEGRVSLLEITHAYSVFTNQGVLVGERDTTDIPSNGEARLQPRAVLRLEEVGGRQLYAASAPQARPVISAQLAYLINHVLTDEIARWPTLGHPNLLEIGRPTGAKIGTTGSGLDSWTVGYTPQLLVGVWVGEPAGQPPGPVSVRAATGLWHAIMQFVSRPYAPEAWEEPPGISRLEVCDPSGLLPTADCPGVVQEIFLDSNQPLQVDNLYRRLQINRETGRLATIFTPPELVEERVYLVVPPEASDWAAEAGLPTPPEDYDLIFAPTTPTPGVQITTPEMFAYESGRIFIRGTASGEGFDFYRLRVGQGLNPRAWLQIGSDRDQPVESGLLGIWDARQLSGLYAIQLVVVRQDQRIDTATIQVTVDNDPPEVFILNPTEDQEFTFPTDQLTTLQARAGDILGLSQVDFYINDELVDSLQSPPFVLPWTLRAGEYSLRVEARDQAGNVSQDEISFRVTR